MSAFGGRNGGSAASKQTISHWVLYVITLAYKAQGVASPLGVKAHTTQIIPACKALSRIVYLRNVCAAAGWSPLHTFIRSYSVNVESTPGSLRSSRGDSFLYSQYGGVGIDVSIASTP